MIVGRVHHFPGVLAIPERINRCIATSLFVFNPISCPSDWFGFFQSRPKYNHVTRASHTPDASVKDLLLSGAGIASFHWHRHRQLPAVIFWYSSRRVHNHFPGENRNELGIELIENTFMFKVYSTINRYSSSQSCTAYQIYSCNIMQLQNIDEYKLYINTSCGICWPSCVLV